MVQALKGEPNTSLRCDLAPDIRLKASKGRLDCPKVQAVKFHQNLSQTRRGFPPAGDPRMKCLCAWFAFCYSNR